MLVCGYVWLVVQYSNEHFNTMSTKRHSLTLALDAVFVQVTATDEDHGVNGQVTYLLLNDLDTFAIETRSGHGHITTTRVSKLVFLPL